jgi:enhancing lycopene biosynthesis protein 2
MGEKKRFAVILSGCGNKDGAEIHESVMTLWAIHKHGAEYQCFAPDIPQHHVLNFITGQEMAESRNVLVESARIARGNIKNAAHKKPIGALCIAPAIVVKVLGNITVTIGQDAATEAALSKMGAVHEKTTHGEITIDKAHNVVTTPCYMLDARVDQIGEGAEKLVMAVLEMVQQ